MNKLVVVLLVLLSISVEADDMKAFAKEAKNTFGLEKYKSKHLKNSEFKAAVATIYTILGNTQEFRIHQLNGEIENRTFLHKDGHREVVFNKDGTAVEGCPNKATYNYYHPYESPLGHFTADILPWLMWGSCRDDSSTIDQRLEAYMIDFRDGFERNNQAGNGFYLPSKFKFKKYGQSESVSFFLKALDEANYNINDFVPKNINNKDEQEIFFKSLEGGIKKLLEKA